MHTVFLTGTGMERPLRLCVTRHQELPATSGAPPHNHQRIRFLHDLPARYWFLSEEGVHDAHGPVFRHRPSVGKFTGVVKGHASTEGNETVPCVPILPNGFLVVVTINKKK